MSIWGITIVGFIGVIAALVTLEILGRRRIGGIPTLSEWLGYVMRSRAGRAVILAGWLWLGWHFFARLRLCTRSPGYRDGRAVSLSCPA
jgi:Family of unknown function (DUF6186)